MVGLSGAVSRIQATSQTYNLDLTLDINTEIYPMKVHPAREARNIRHETLNTPPWWCTVSGFESRFTVTQDVNTEIYPHEVHPET